jgi:flagellar protein FlaF
MQRAAQTYGAVAKQTANPRELEADLLLTAAARLQAIHDGWESRRPELDAALVYNRKLWSIFVTSATSVENPLPAPIRQNVANLGLFVFNQRSPSRPIQNLKASDRSSISTASWRRDCSAVRKTLRKIRDTKDRGSSAVFLAFKRRKRAPGY